MRDLIEKKQIKLYHINGKKNSTDILTKNLGQAHSLLLLLLNS